MAIIDFYAGVRFDAASTGISDNFLRWMSGAWRQYDIVENSAEAWIVALDRAVGGAVFVGFFPSNIFRPGSTSERAPPAGIVGAIALYDGLGMLIAVFDDLTGMGLSAAEFIGTPTNLVSAADDFLGSGDTDVFAGGAGDDIFNGQGGRDTLRGDSGADYIYGGDGDDALLGGADDDILIGGAGNDTLTGGDGADVASFIDATSRVIVSLSIDSAQNTVGAGFDTLSGIEDLVGSQFGDTLTGNGADNALLGLDGNDTLNGGGGADAMVGGLGQDTYVIDAADTILEEAAQGIDTVVSGLINTTLAANTEILNMTGAAFRGIGNNGANTLNGTDADNILSGALAPDRLNGFGGNDRLIGGAQADTLTGGDGADTFVFASALGRINIDIISDFDTSGGDLVELGGAFFPGLAAGGLSANAFHVGAAAADADDRIVYDAATGALYFDIDGAGVGRAKQFATLEAGLALTEAHFTVT